MLENIDPISQTCLIVCLIKWIINNWIFFSGEWSESCQCRLHPYWLFCSIQRIASSSSRTLIPVDVYQFETNDFRQRWLFPGSENDFLICSGKYCTKNTYICLSIHLYDCLLSVYTKKTAVKTKTHNLSVILVQDVIAKQSERNVILFIHIRQSYTFDLLSVLNEIGWLSRPHVLIRDTNKHETYWACWDPKNPPSLNSGKK